MYQLRNGVRWRDLPREYGSGPTCWRRHREWTAGGVWEDVWQLVLEELAAAGGVDPSELFADATFVPSGEAAGLAAASATAAGGKQAELAAAAEGLAEELRQAAARLPVPGGRSE